MVVEYPRTPGIVPVPGHVSRGNFLAPGEGVNAHPFEAEQILDFTVPLGSGTGAIYGIVFQLPKWGFKRVKIDESIEVTPTFKNYFDLTIGQKQAMEVQIKQGLGSISNSVSDMELVKHDLRKYKEFMDYFAMIDWGKKLVKEGKKEEGEDLVTRADNLLKSVFIDQVDAHTGEGIAMRSIAARWPTLITDFMKLNDNDKTREKIKVKTELHGISEAEAVVLSTKNTLYLEWRDVLFRPTVKERYESLVGLAVARKKSVEEYRKMLRPILARYKSIREVMSLNASFYQKTPFVMEGSQAISIDTARIWGWKPFAPSEKYKNSREAFDEITPDKVGFMKWETEEILKKLKAEHENTNIKDVAVDKFLKGIVEALPAEPSIDNVLRKKIIPLIEKEYGVKIGPLEIFKARSALVEQFRLSGRGSSEGESWVFSPYFVFVDIPITRTVIRMPNGQEAEDLWIQYLTTATRTQNIIIGLELEVIARDMQMDKYIDQMLGEKGVIPLLESGEPSVEDIIGSEVFKPKGTVNLTKDKIKEKIFELKSRGLLDENIAKSLEIPVKEVKDILKKRYEEATRPSSQIQLFDKIGKFFAGTPIGRVQFFASRGPYEFNIGHRLAKIYQPEAGMTHALIANYFKSTFGVPGAKV